MACRRFTGGPDHRKDRTVNEPPGGRDRTICVICTREATLGQTCRQCYDRLREQLSEIPIAYEQAADELAPGQTGHAGGAEPSIGLRISALDLRHAAGYINELGEWARQWRLDKISDPAELQYVCDINYHPDDATNSTGPNDRGEQTPPTADYSALHATLHRYGKGATDTAGTSLRAVIDELIIGLHEACKRFGGIREFADSVRQLHGQARAASQTTPRQAWVVQCPADHEPDGRCALPLRISGDDFGTAVVCPRCHTQWDVQRLLLVAESDTESTLWLPAEEIQLLLGVKERTLRRWAAKGNVIREHGRYDVGSVRTAIADGAARHADQIA